MKFTVQTKAFRSAIDAVKYATGSKLKEALKGIYCEATSMDTVTLQATDLEIGIVYRLTAGVSVASLGACILPTEQIAKLLRETNASHVDLTKRNGVLYVIAGESLYELPLIPEEDFPQLNSPTGERVTVRVPLQSLLSAFGQVGFAVGEDQTRYNVNGVLMDVGKEPKSCTLVATDTRKLALATIQTEAEAIPFQCIIPARAFKLLQTCPDQSGICEISQVKNDVVFTTEAVAIHSRLIEGRYPPYGNIVPKSHDTRVTIEADELAALVRAVDVTANQGRLEVEFDANKQTIRIEALSERGRATTQKTDCSVSGNSVKITLASDYLLQFLATCKGQSLIVRLNGSSKPVLIFPDDGRTFLLMPMAD